MPNGFENWVSRLRQGVLERKQGFAACESVFLNEKWVSQGATGIFEMKTGFRNVRRRVGEIFRVVATCDRTKKRSPSLELL